MAAPAPSTREALLAHGALLFARHGVAGVTARQLHDAIGARNESALHYHFGGKDGLAGEIVRLHLAAIEARRAPLADAIRAEGRERDLRALVHALAAPMAADLADELGRAHLRIVAQVSHPALAYERPFQVVDAPAGREVVAWLWDALDPLPDPLRWERLAALRGQLISLFALRAQLVDERPGDLRRSPPDLFLANLLDQVVAGMACAPSPEAASAATHAAPAGPGTATAVEP